MAGQLRSPTRQRSPRHARIAGQPHRADCRADRPSTWWRHAGSRRRRSRPSDSGRSGGCSRGARTGQCRYAGLPATATSAGLRQDEILGCSAGSGGNAGIIWSRAGERPPGIRRLRIFRLTRFRSPRGHCSGAAVEHRLPRGFRPRRGLALRTCLLPIALEHHTDARSLFGVAADRVAGRWLWDGRSPRVVELGVWARLFRPGACWFPCRAVFRCPACPGGVGDDADRHPGG